MKVKGGEGMTPKEQGALNTLLLEKKNQIEELEINIVESKLKIKLYRDNIKKLENDIEKLKKMYRKEVEEKELDVEEKTREYEEQKEKERLHLLKANAVEIL